MSFLLSFISMIIVFEFSYIFVIYILLRWPGKFSLLRRLVAIANGMVSLDSQDIVFQEDIFSCGFASMRMLAKQINSTELEKAIEMNSQGLLFITMLEMIQFIRRNGFKAHGYEFKGIDELEAFMSQESCSGMILLINNYDDVLSFASLLMKPFYFVMRIFQIGDNFGRELNHWVVMDQVLINKVILKDPIFGKVRLTKRRMNKLWCGNALVILSTQKVVGLNAESNKSFKKLQ